MNKIKHYLPWLLLAGTLLFALAFRTYRIAVLPDGLFPDEAANGLDINLMEQGIFQPFYERGNGREALFFYLLWGSVKLLGRSPLAHHLVSALVGTLTVAACYLAGKELFKWNGGKSAAVLSAFLIAVSSWHVVLSRTAFRANLIPLLSALTLWAMLKVGTSIKQHDVSDKNKREENNSLTKLTAYHPTAYGLLFGAFFALGFYTYIAFRIMAPLIAMLVLWPALAYIRLYGFKTLIKTFYKPALSAIVSFAIVFAPLGYYFYSHPGSFVGRSGQVSVFNPELNKGDLAGTIIDVSKKSILAYFTTGDLNWRHNISGFPFIQPLISPFFALGLILCIAFAVRYFLFPIRYSHNYPEFLLAGWFFTMLIPVITTAEGIPHGLRAIGTIPAVFIIAAYGIYTLYSLIKKYIPRYSVFCLLFTIFLIVALPVQTYHLYFIQAANNPEYNYAFRSDLTAVSEYLKKFGDRKTTYLILDKFSIQTVDYLTTKIGATSCDRDPHYRTWNCLENPINKPYVQIDPEDSWRPGDFIKDNGLMWENGLKPGDEIVFTESSLFDLKKFKENHPNVKQKLTERNHLGRHTMAVYVMQ